MRRVTLYGLSMIYLTLSVQPCFAQAKTSQAELNEQSKALVIKFYQYLMTNDIVSIENFETMFGHESGLMEEASFLDALTEDHKKDSLGALKKHFSNKAQSMSYAFNEYRGRKKELTFGLGLDALESLVSTSSRDNEGCLVLRFSGNQVLRFRVSVGEDLFTPHISGIFMSDGSLLLNASEFVKYKGGIEDKDGYVNVRDGQSIQGEVVGKLYNHDFLWFTPSVTSSWWRVYSIDRFRFLGYVHNSRLKIFDELSPIRQKEIAAYNKGRYKWIEGLLEEGY